jgi:DNA gyrase inhibitor GyrI
MGEEKNMRRKWIMLAAIIGVIIIGGIFAGPIMSDVETPNYEVISAQAGIEIRQYAPMIIAEVQMDGEREDAIGNGFRLLADYIFGNNQGLQDIAMTAPVQQQKNIKIAMTAPVQQQSIGDIWRVSFVMPSEYSMETLPKPVNDRVAIKRVPSKQFIVVTFAGTNSNKNVTVHEEKLMRYVKANNLSVVGAPTYAFYNPPWTLPPMRRNEVMMEMEMEK